MDADKLLRLAHYAGEMQAVLIFVTFLGILGWITAGFFAVKWILLKPKYEREQKKNKSQSDLLLKKMAQVGQLQKEVDDVEFVKGQLRALDKEHDLLKAQHEILKANHDELNTRALRYRRERNESDTKLIQRNKDFEELTTHFHVPLMNETVK